MKYTLRSGRVILISDQSLDVLEKYKWRFNKDGYVVRSSRHGNIFLHRVLKNCPEGFCVDHIYHDKNDYRLDKLRIVTLSENSTNQPKRKKRSSDYYGVYISKTGKYISEVRIKSKKTHLGSFSDEIKAAEAYDHYVVNNKLDEFKPINFPANKYKYLQAEKQEKEKEKISEYCGVTYNNGKFVSRITIDKKRILLLMILIFD